MSPKNNILVISGNGMQLSSVIIEISSLHSPAYTNLHNLLLALVVVSFELNSRRKKMHMRVLEKRYKKKRSNVR